MTKPAPVVFLRNPSRSTRSDARSLPASLLRKYPSTQLIYFSVWGINGIRKVYSSGEVISISFVTALWKSAILDIRIRKDAAAAVVALTLEFRLTFHLPWPFAPVLVSLRLALAALVIGIDMMRARLFPWAFGRTNRLAIGRLKMIPLTPFASLLIGAGEPAVTQDARHAPQLRADAIADNGKNCGGN
jgi:hypothetical protein